MTKASLLASATVLLLWSAASVGSKPTPTRHRHDHQIGVALCDQP